MQLIACADVLPGPPVRGRGIITEWVQRNTPTPENGQRQGFLPPLDVIEQMVLHEYVDDEHQHDDAGRNLRLAAFPWQQLVDDRQPIHQGRRGNASPSLIHYLGKTRIAG